MLDSLIELMQSQGEAAGYAILGAASLIEYVFPPFPGDSVALFGVFLAATAGYHAALVWLALTFGSLVGGFAVWRFGRWAGAHRERWPAFLRTPQAQQTLANIEAGFARHGAIYLASNRFVPVSRALFFVAAGLTNMPLPKTLFWGTLSAALWNAMLLGAGFAIGTNFEALEALYQRYTTGALVVFAIVGVLLFVRWRRRRMAENNTGNPR